MIKTIDKIVVGTKYHESLNKENPILSFMTPFSEDEAYNKRFDTLKHWCCNYKTIYNQETKAYDKIKLEEKFHIFDNTPLEGFKINESVSRWSTSNKWFRVVDPRGFMLEISSDNLCSILLTTKVEYGEIKSKCIWCRDGATNILVPIESEDYKKAIEGTKLSTVKPISNKDLKFGYEYFDKQGGKVVYLGKLKESDEDKLKLCFIYIGTYSTSIYFKNSHSYVKEGNKIEFETLIKHIKEDIEYHNKGLIEEKSRTFMGKPCIMESIVKYHENRLVLLNKILKVIGRAKSD